MEQVEGKLDAPLQARAGRRAALLPGETDNARAYTSLKQAVLSGAFRPGEVVTLRALATRSDHRRYPGPGGRQTLGLRGCI